MKRALFVTYASLPADTTGTSMIGVIKRCVRLIAALPRGEVDPHLLHFGPLPRSDALLNEILPSLPRHEPGFGEPDEALRRLYRHLKPHVVVLGEGPGRGMMGTASAIAAQENIPQICVENYYSPRQPDLFVRFSPAIDQWLLLGLPNGSSYGRISPQAVLVPPLLSDAITIPRRRARVTILGYDRMVGRMGLALLDRLPHGTSSRLVDAEALPDDAALRGFLQTSHVVVCKNGFQQIIESLASGTPTIVYQAAGGVPESWLHESLRPFVCYLPANGDWSRVLVAASVWLSRKPSMPWSAAIAALQQPVRIASTALLGLLREYS